MRRRDNKESDESLDEKKGSDRRMKSLVERSNGSRCGWVVQRYDGRDAGEEKSQMLDRKKRSTSGTQSSPNEKNGDADGRKSWKLEGRTLVLVRRFSQKFQRRVVLVRRRAVLKEYR